MSLLVYTFPVAVVTIVVVLVLVGISALSKVAAKKFTALQAILGGVQFIALTAIVLTVVQIGFTGIEKWIADALVDTASRMRSLITEARYSLSVLVIVSPIYIVLLRVSAKQAKKGVLWMHRFVAGSIVSVVALVELGTLIALVYNFLSGELGLRLGVKIAFLFAVMAGVAVFYQVYLRARTPNIRLVTSDFTISAGVVIVLMIVLGFYVTGGPLQARAERFDSLRLRDLSDIQQQVSLRWMENGAMPNMLAQLDDPILGFSVPADPRTGEAYEYHVIGERSEYGSDGIKRLIATFRMCATFETVRAYADAGDVYKDVSTAQAVPFVEDVAMRPYYEGDTSPHWNHPAGRYCFERTIRRTLDTGTVVTPTYIPASAVPVRSQ